MRAVHSCISWLGLFFIAKKHRVHSYLLLKLTSLTKKQGSGKFTNLPTSYSSDGNIGQTSRELFLPVPTSGPRATRGVEIGGCFALVAGG